MDTQDTTAVIYQLCEPYGERVDEPVIGPPDLDIEAYVAQYRAERYAEAEAKQDDYCIVSEEGLVDWLIAKGIVRPLPYQRLTVRVETTGEHAYLPKHWPECPQCRRGRGEEQSGDIRHSLNRWTWYRKCTECGHTWGHHDQPYDSKHPMLEDDGRYIQNGCVPYTISQVTDFPIEAVLDACRERGWTEDEGMYDSAGLAVVRSLGWAVQSISLAGVEGKPTLRRVMSILSPTKSYIIGTKGHWLAVVRGENRDQGGNTLRVEVLNCWEVTT